jgi:phospholipase C
MRNRRLVNFLALVCWAASWMFWVGSGHAAPPANNLSTATPIQYLVVIFQENNAFDHYFGTYPHAANPPGEPPFVPAPGTPAVNGLTGPLLTANPNFLNSANGAGAVNPFRLDRSQASTCDNINHYMAEQLAYHGGLLDLFPTYTSATTSCPPGVVAPPGLAMGYYDGNTVTALWNYAQRYAMSDYFFATEFGTTVMGHINLVSGDTHQTNVLSNADIANGSIIANINPSAALDDCTSGKTITMTSKNVGDLLNAQGVTWGWFYGDFAATLSNGVAQCSANYNPHYDPFQYYASTANPHHLPPSSVSAIGQTDQANHQYALTDFFNALNSGNLPSVSFLKASFGETGHPSDGTPLQEQTFLVNTINQLVQSPQWPHMAILITYDDSDGWYDHVMPPIVNQSADPAQDALLGPGLCGTLAPGAYNDRCGYGPRLPLLAISPFARRNYVDHSLTDQTSILRFIEDNWSLGRIGDQSFDAIAGSILGLFDFDHPRNQRLLLDPDSGEPVRGQGRGDDGSFGGRRG